MSGSRDEARARAEARFQKQQAADQQAVEAKAQRETQARAVDVNTARLRSLRLAKEAADKEAQAKTKTRSATIKKKPFTLTEPRGRVASHGESARSRLPSFGTSLGLA